MSRRDGGPTEETPEIGTWRKHVREQAGDGAPVVVLLHGRGSDERDLLALRGGLRGGALITPRAPHPAAPWGYGPGWAWYRYVADDRMVEETLDRSLRALDRFLDRLPGLLPWKPGPLLLGGFSQGATTSLAYALRYPERAEGVLVFSGFLAAEAIAPSTHASGLPVFWGHGRRDPAIPFELADRGRRRLAGAGADLRIADYDIGHWIDEGEVRDAALWVEELLERRGDGSP
ncbi:MAG: alpha/beta hydrolase-fold protein [Gemmatimonadota bacterium]|jgi:phospholipase/carboxylesterase